ncbi:MAG TPA: alpha/beta hydrolase [Solirubrobacteraceae bacterium]|jgi:acetyl esterase/lipase|nr:alpha/beta hydrolase [Solirubrobacteraceae bacterium]
MHDVDAIRDIEFAVTEQGPLALDLYRPATDRDRPVPVVVYFHGGGWAVGDRTMGAADRLVPLAARGVAVASASYRLTDAATYPAQVDDARAAVRWLRANGAEHGLATERIGAWGASAGGYLALMLGIAGEVPAVCEYFAVTDLLETTKALAAAFPPPPFIDPALPPPQPSYEARLLGLERTSDNPEAAVAASPLHLAGAAPAGGRYLLLHGDRDGLVHHQESVAMHEALVAHGIDSTLLLISGANHEGPEFDRPEVLSAVAGFFLDALGG